jgi:hypothetical protein
VLQLECSWLITGADLQCSSACTCLSSRHAAVGSLGMLELNWKHTTSDRAIMGATLWRGTAVNGYA